MDQNPYESPLAPTNEMAAGDVKTAKGPSILTRLLFVGLGIALLFLLPQFGEVSYFAMIVYYASPTRLTRGLLFAAMALHAIFLIVWIVLLLSC